MRPSIFFFLPPYYVSETLRRPRWASFPSPPVSCGLSPLPLRVLLSDSPPLFCALLLILIFFPYFTPDKERFELGSVLYPSCVSAVVILPMSRLEVPPIGLLLFISDDATAPLLFFLVWWNTLSFPLVARSSLPLPPRSDEACGPYQLSSLFFFWF